MPCKPIVTVISALLLAGCGVATGGGPVATSGPLRIENTASGQQSFSQIVSVVEPVAEQECRNRTRGVNCNFKIGIDPRADQPANAYQTLNDAGRPIIIFTQALIDDAQNSDELAFVLGHEAAHHIAGHIARQQQNAVAGAVIGGVLAVLVGGGAETVQSAQRTGAQLGARSYSKDFELEADALGTVITARAGYNPLRGAQFFARIPDPGDKFLGTHPPNSQRLETVRRTAAGL
ncbi:Beta-barrel assembly-enhancing protease [Roseobacter fucihabitans]|uniref:Beta-barrel assembly-enhancing protease n=1 Tax=Roseobacter fucihabitans TaxID=1537242 RepID=A0ABZ2BVL4_9RHOB|nr:M48 family metallopeptidase [Roseobacter litoralis]MBC6968014.1 TPR repeat-containing protein YfgC precursor [Roseobacter litoralis]